MGNNVKAGRGTRGRGSAGVPGPVTRGGTHDRKRGGAAAGGRERRDLGEERLVIARGCRALAAAARERGAPGEGPAGGRPAKGRQAAHRVAKSRPAGKHPARGKRADGATSRRGGEWAPGCTALRPRSTGEVVDKGRPVEGRSARPAKAGGPVKPGGAGRASGAVERDASVEVGAPARTGGPRGSDRAVGTDCFVNSGRCGEADGPAHSVSVDADRSVDSGSSRVPGGPSAAGRAEKGARRGEAKAGTRRRRRRRRAAGDVPALGTGVLPRAGGEGMTADRDVAAAAVGNAASLVGDEKARTAPVLQADEDRDARLARAGVRLERARRRAEVLDRRRTAAQGSEAFPRYHRRDAARRDLMRRRIRWTLRQATKEARERGDAGMATAEYAVALLAAVGIATALYKVVTSGAVQSALQSAVMKALHG